MQYLPIIIAAAVVFIIVMVLGYVQSPPDKAIIISGARKRPRVCHYVLVTQ